MGEREGSTHGARIRWSGGEGEDVRAHTIELADQRLAASSTPAYGGDPSKADPEELLVAAAASCHMLWFLALARAEKIGVASYEDEPEGRIEEGRFAGVVLRPRIAFAVEVTNEQIDSLHRRAHERCFVASSLRCGVEVEPRPSGRRAA